MDGRVSIIIPCKSIDDYTIKCLEVCKTLKEEPEIILLPDEMPKTEQKGIVVIPTGPVPPGKKRNIGYDRSTGSYCAFLDSDAYPRNDWLKNALAILQDPQIIAVGGPGVTPLEDNAKQRAGGMVYESILMGNLGSRYLSHEIKESDDIHSCNLIVKKDAMAGVKWTEKYWPGEDTLFCLDLKKKGVGKMVESGDVVIFHHRRELFRKHLKQVSAFGLHRGFFFKRFPETSRKPLYAMPLFIVLVTIALPILGILLNPIFLLLFGLEFVAYLIVAVHASRKEPRLLAWVFSGLIVTNWGYGLSYLKGLLKKELKR